MTPPTTLIIGSYLSPFVRKVLACLEYKGIPYQLDPVVPFYGNDDFARISPLRRIPVLVDDQLSLCDSTVICEYLEERYPTPRLYPATTSQRARARWLEEYADTHLAEVLIWRFFNQLVIRRHVWGEAPDQAVLDKAVGEEIPRLLDFLEQELPATGLLFGDLTVADIAIASPFRNAQFAGFNLDNKRWPKVAAFLDRVLQHPALAALAPMENLCARTPIAQHRAVLADAGAPLSQTSCAATTPRRGLVPRH